LSIILVVIAVGTIFLRMLKSPILIFFDYCLNVLRASAGWYGYFACQSFLGTPYTSEIVSSTESYMVVEMVGVYTILFGKFFDPHSVGKHHF
jgi:hypothetical protein